MEKYERQSTGQNSSPKGGAAATAASHSSTRRIARNTLMLYFRQILIMLVSLYTSRVTLAVLGISDYGIYNVIGGMVAMLSVVSGSMSVTISRFIVFEVGRGDTERLRKIFSTSIFIQTFISAVVIAICEGLGIWFIHNKMNIPPERMSAGVWVMQCSLITFCICLLSVPYNAIIVAHERMSAFAYISILEVVLRLLCVLILKVVPLDRLVVYAVLLCLVQSLIRFVYGAYCKRYFRESCQLSFSFDRTLLFKMFSFIGWAFLGNGIVVVKDSGINILLNLFFGPAMNTARGVAGQVNSAVNSFVSNFMMALNPQITKSYAERKLPEMHKLVIRGQKISFYILFILVFVFCSNPRLIISLWLKEVPPHTVSIVVLILLYALIDTYANPLLTGVLAEGNIKGYEITISVVYGINIAAAYLLIKIGKPVEFVFAGNILFKVAVCVALLAFSRMKYSFPLRRFFIECLFPTAVVFSICVCLARIFRLYGAENVSELVFQSALNLSIASVIVFAVGLSKSERSCLCKIIKSKIKYGV